MNFPLCFSSLGCPDFSVEELCRLARAQNISRVEIRSLEGWGDFALHLADVPEKLRQTLAFLAQQEIEVRILGSSFCLTHHGPEHLDSLVREGRVADSLGTPFLRIFGGGADTEVLSSELVQRAKELYQTVIRRFQNEGIRTVPIVETHGGFTRSDRILQFCDALEQPAAILWDTHHTWKIGRECPSDTYTRIRPFVRHLHLKDSVATPGQAHAYRYVLPGEGEFPFEKLFLALGSNPSGATLSLEWEKKWHPELPSLEEALHAWKKIIPA